MRGDEVQAEEIFLLKRLHVLNNLVTSEVVHVTVGNTNVRITHLLQAFLYVVWWKEVVCIHEEEEVAARGLRAGVAGEGEILPLNTEVPHPLLCIGCCNFLRVVIRGIIYHDNVLRQHGLCEEAFDCSREVGAVVVAGDDDRNAAARPLAPEQGGSVGRERHRKVFHRPELSQQIVPDHAHSTGAWCSAGAPDFLPDPQDGVGQPFEVDTYGEGHNGYQEENTALLPDSLPLF